MLQQEDLLRRFRYDPDTGDLFRAGEAKPIRTTVRGYYVAARGGVRDGYTHRIIWTMFNGSVPASIEIDHKDGVKTNNRLTNLRLATRTQNMRNSKKYAGCTSKFKGVSWFRRTNKWLAVITAEGRLKYLGTFVSEVDAAKAYDAAALLYFGEFARTNDQLGLLK